MPATAAEMLKKTRSELAPDPNANPWVPLVAGGRASPGTLAVLALEQHRVIPADRRAFLHLAQRATEEPAAAGFFTALAEGEELAAARLGAFAEACAVDEERMRAYEPLPGCQAYPAYLSWLALNAAPADAVLAVTANFATWGTYCASIAQGLRTHYGFTDEACAFFDFFAAPAPALDRQATAAVEAGLHAGRLDERRVYAYGRLLQAYEQMFWTSLSALA
ncbi:thiaminase II/PqqC family protein [Streptomyces shenzhenensis]|uniref:transcriptional regulator n=1 Tax=Streptomyces shenzhenensis TaxID=943815 RepID=UPI0015EFEA00|nr:transcriptional regulator [Streptomyces shenzhenensis]